jgi:hypothetical protein
MDMEIEWCKSLNKEANRIMLDEPNGAIYITFKQTPKPCVMRVPIDGNFTGSFGSSNIVVTNVTGKFGFTTNVGYTNKSQTNHTWQNDVSNRDERPAVAVTEETLGSSLFPVA